MERDGYSQSQRARAPLATRRSMLIASVSGLAATLTLRCGGNRKPSPSTSATAKQPRRGGILRVGGGKAGSYDLQGRSFDPYIQTQVGAEGYTLFYERLLAYNLRTYEVEAELAQKWEQPSQTEYVFHLQPGVKWQDKPPVNGRPLTVDDITWSLERAGANDPKLFTRSFLSHVDKIEAPDASTIKLTTKSIDVSTLKKLAVDNLAVLAREVFEKFPQPTTAEAVVGTGAFIMKSLEPGQEAEYVRNPNYWKPSLPYLDGLQTLFFPDVPSAWNAYLAHQVDMIGMGLTGPEVKDYLNREKSSSSAEWFTEDTTFIHVPNTRMKPFDDPRVTRALRLLMDHEGFVKGWAEVLQGRGRYGSIFPTALSAWDLTDAEYQQQLEWKQPKDEAAKEALSLLNAAGYSKDKPLQFGYTADNVQNGSSQEIAAELTQAQFKKLSQGVVDMQIKPVDIPTFDKMRGGKTFAYAYSGTSVGVVDPDGWLSTVYYTGASQNFAGFSDPTVDAMIDKQRTILNDKERAALVKQIILYLIDHGPTTIGANWYDLQAVGANVQNHAPEHSLNGRQYQSMWLSS